MVLIILELFVTLTYWRFLVRFVITVTYNKSIRSISKSKSKGKVFNVRVFTKLFVFLFCFFYGSFFEYPYNFIVINAFSFYKHFSPNNKLFL